jgi:hypothetical protein
MDPKVESVPWSHGVGVDDAQAHPGMETEWRQRGGCGRLLLEPVQLRSALNARSAPLAASVQTQLLGPRSGALPMSKLLSRQGGAGVLRQGWKLQSKLASSWPLSWEGQPAPLEDFQACRWDGLTGIARMAVAALGPVGGGSRTWTSYA